MKTQPQLDKFILTPAMKEILSHAAPTVVRRMTIELMVTARVIEDLKNAGYELEADCGEGAPIKSAALDTLLKELFSCDEAFLFATKGKKRLWVYLVLGNDGWDVITDYLIELEPVMQPIIEWTNILEEEEHTIMSYLSKSDIRRDPDSEEAQELSKQHDRDVFAAKMQYALDNHLPPFDEDEEGEPDE